MKLKEMNDALQGLRDKYAVPADGVLVASAAGSWGQLRSWKSMENAANCCLGVLNGALSS